MSTVEYILTSILFITRMIVKINIIASNIITKNFYYYNFTMNSV